MAEECAASLNETIPDKIKENIFLQIDSESRCGRTKLSFKINDYELPYCEKVIELLINEGFMVNFNKFDFDNSILDIKW